VCWHTNLTSKGVNYWQVNVFDLGFEPAKNRVDRNHKLDTERRDKWKKRKTIKRQVTLRLKEKKGNGSVPSVSF
jgi:hypothetical protein